ncbi:MAG: HEAT repeat domain-containing protein [Lachnospiraceae bacterium]|nr:HEAT repeat domain-containing protein [Lachnospiraceae bacterium]
MRKRPENKLDMGKIDKINRYAKRRKTGKLRRLAYDSDRSIRMAAIEGLGKLTGDIVSENALVMLLGDSDSEIAEAAAKALSNSQSSYARVQLEYYYAKKMDKVELEAVRSSYTQGSETFRIENQKQRI